MQENLRDALAQYIKDLKSTIPVDPDEVVVSDYARGCLHTTKHVIAMLGKMLKEQDNYLTISDKPLVTELNRTCFACPSKWEGCTEDGQHVYIRYRWGFLSASVGNDQIYGASHGDSLDGDMSNEDMKNALSGVLRFSDGLLE